MKTNFNNKKNLVRDINTQNNTPFGIADSLKLRNSNSQILNEKIENNNEYSKSIVLSNRLIKRET